MILYISISGSIDHLQICLINGILKSSNIQTLAIRINVTIVNIIMIYAIISSIICTTVYSFVP